MVSGRPKITSVDIMLGGLMGAAAVFIVYRVSIGLNYTWNWDALPQYFIRFDASTRQWIPNVLLHGFLTTIRLSIWATLLATLIGVVMGMLRASQSLFKRLLAGSYVELTRNLPPLVLIFIFYYFVSEQILPAREMETFIRSRGESTQALMTFLFAAPPRFSAFMSGLITLSIFEGAYIAEIVRAGIQSIEKGQWEAADALGLSRWQRMRRVILPQAI
ncbi:MAG: ABC transporter permease subunit, partial [Desulfobacterales bacterium]|nr:ABC transporter permease subunit [Desulfobacterales bacterium]